jgi:hypothetical protein
VQVKRHERTFHFLTDTSGGHHDVTESMEVTMEVLAPAFTTPTEVRAQTDVLRVRYPKLVSPLFATIFHTVFVGAGLAFVAAAFKVWDMGIYGPAVWLWIVGGFVTPMFIRNVIRHLAAWVRSVRGAWWLRLSTTGFEVNDRLLGAPHRHKWCEIDSFVLARKSGAGECVGYRYSRECHRFRPRRGTKPDGFIIGHWDRPPEQAVDLMADWLTRYRAA